MRASVIVPTKNRAVELKTALDAIASQTHRDLEIIVIDDGSDAENARSNKGIVDALSRGALYRYLSGDDPSGHGPSHVRNVGIKQASGEIVLFCDDDDHWCDDQHVAAAAAAFAANESLDLLIANQEARKGGKVVDAVWLPLLEKSLVSGQESSQSGARISKTVALIDGHAHINVCVFRKELLHRIGGFWESVRYLEDLDLYARAVDSARYIAYRRQTVSIHNIPDRTRAVNASTQLDAQEKDLAQAQVANHLAQHCRSHEVLRCADRVGGDACRRLALAASLTKQDRKAFIFAKLALSWRFSFKWAAYTLLLGLKALLAKDPWDMR